MTKTPARIVAAALIVSFPVSPHAAIASEARKSGLGGGKSESANAVPRDFVGRASITRERNRFFPVVASLVMPGFDQWWEGQYAYAGTYTGASVLSGAYVSSLRDGLSEEESSGFLSSPTDRQLKILMGGQISMIASGLSSYQAYRTAVVSQQKYGGNFGFLRHHEPISRLAMAPLDFSFLTRSTSYIPLGVGAAIHLLAMTSLAGAGPDAEIRKDRLTAIEAMAVPVLSYGAGVSEEAIFRGWLMPEFYQLTGSPFWSNTITAGLFAAAHLGDIEVPWPQFLLGWYWGWLTQQNQWQIAEAAFIHAWWDVFAFLTIFQIRQKDPAAWVDRSPPRLWLPKLQWNF